MAMAKRRREDHEVEPQAPEEVDWAQAEETRRAWLTGGGDHGAHLEFLADQGLRLIMADLWPEGGESLHFYSPHDRETVHLRAARGEDIFTQAAEDWPAMARWIELIYGSDAEGEGATGICVARDGLLVEVSGGRLRRVREAAREFPQGALYGTRARQAGVLLEEAGGWEGTARAAAFAQALEDARGMRVPLAAAALRAVLAETARACSHLEWMEILSISLGRPGVSRGCRDLRQGLEARMREWLGPSGGRGWIFPGGVREDLPLQGAGGMAEWTAEAVGRWEGLLPGVLALPIPGWAERRLRPLRDGEARRGWVGPLARAAGMEVDARREEPGIYAAVGWEMAVAPPGGGMLGRLLRVKASETGSALRVSRRILEDLPPTALLAKRGRGGRGEGFGRCEGPEGEVCCHVILERGQVAFLSFSLPRELNRSAARRLAGSSMDEWDILSLLWGIPRYEDSRHSGEGRQRQLSFHG